MVETKKKSPPYSRSRLRKGCATFACLLFSEMVLDCVTPDGAASPGTTLRSPRPIDMDPRSAERIGREALAKIGYLPILDLARQAGWVTTKERRRPIGGDRSLISIDVAQAAAASEFIEVFSTYAVAAGVASQADSPLPGPGDLVGIGILVVGLIDAALLAGALIHAFADVSTPATTSTTTSPAPVTKPDQEPQPEGEPKTTGTTSPPTDRSPEPEKETCEEQRPDRIRCDDPKIRGYHFSSENAAYSSIKVKGLRKEQSKKKAEDGPCEGRGGFHTKVLRGKDYIASIVGCYCCDDSSGKAIEKEKAHVHYH